MGGQSAKGQTQLFLGLRTAVPSGLGRRCVCRWIKGWLKQSLCPVLEWDIDHSSPIGWPCLRGDSTPRGEGEFADVPGEDEPWDGPLWEWRAAPWLPQQDDGVRAQERRH